MSLDHWVETVKPSGLTFTTAGRVERVKLHDKLLGWISRKNQTFTSPRSREEHFFRKYKGWGLNAKLLSILVRQKVTTIILLLKKEDVKLTVRTGVWFSKGINYKHSKYEPQLILPESYFTEVSA